MIARSHFLYRFLFFTAAVYNISFAVWLWFSYTSLFGLISISIPFPSVLIKPLAIGISLFAIVYLYAAIRPDGARVLIFFCLLAKILPPFIVIGFILFLDWPVAMWKMMLFNDVIWWIPFLLFIKQK